MKVIERIREDFEKKARQPGYSVDEFIRAAEHFGRTLYTRTVRGYTSNHNLRRDLKKMRINLTGSTARYLIPKSNLVSLMEGMKVRTTLEEFQEELELQRTRESHSISIKGRNRKVDRL